MRLCLLLGFLLVVAVAVIAHADPGQSKSRGSESQQVSSKDRRVRKPKDDEKSRKPSGEGVSKTGRAKGTKSSAKGRKVPKSANAVDPQRAKMRKTKTYSKTKDGKSGLRGKKIIRKKLSKTKAIDQGSDKTPQTVQECPGECIKSEEECPSGVAQEGGCQDGLKCCVDDAESMANERASCPATSKCQSKNGVCQGKQLSCNGKLKKNKRFCGRGCGCCLPAKKCKTKSKCSNKKGTCQANTAACVGDLINEKGYCGSRRRCVCCVPNSGQLHHGWRLSGRAPRGCEVE